MLIHDLAPSLKWDRHSYANNKACRECTGNAVDDEASFPTLSCHSVTPREADHSSAHPADPIRRCYQQKLAPEHLTVCVCCSRWAVCSSACKLLHLWDLGGVFALQIQDVSVPRWIGPETTSMEGVCFWVDNATCIMTTFSSYWG